MGPPEKETPHPSTLGGWRGNAGQASTRMDGSAEHSAATVRARRALRFQAQGHARGLLARRARATHPDKHPGDVYRTASCKWSRIASEVTVWRDQLHGSAHYSGIATCGSVWACPICASKIQERRRAEVENAMTWAKENDLTPVLVTLTFPHTAFDHLRELLQKQADALGRFRRSRAYVKLMRRVGFAGLIRSLEVTHGPNGWHPHTHELQFHEPRNAMGLHAELTRLWESACRSAGLLDESKVEAFRLHAVDVQFDVTSGDYLAKQDDSRKWGLAHEVAKATSKQGRAKGVHPHHFLVRRAPGDDALYFEYIEGMKGRRQLFWSHGLKAQVGVAEKSDEEVAEEETQAALQVCTLDRAAWNLVRGNDARAEVLDAAERDGETGVEVLLRSLGSHLGEGYEAQRSTVHQHTAERSPVEVASCRCRSCEAADAAALRSAVQYSVDAIGRCVAVDRAAEVLRNLPGPAGLQASGRPEPHDVRCAATL